MTNSMQMLRLAHQMRNDGTIPQHVAFWAVENPLTNRVDRLKRKVSCCDLCALPANHPRVQHDGCNEHCPSGTFGLNAAIADKTACANFTRL